MIDLSELTTEERLAITEKRLASLERLVDGNNIARLDEEIGWLMGRVEELQRALAEQSRVNAP